MRVPIILIKFAARELIKRNIPKQMEVILWAVLSGFAVLVTALVVSLHYHRKYSPVLRQMSERLYDNNEIGTAKETKPFEDVDEKLFRQLTETIRNEQLYTVPKFGRTELVERFHLSSKRISTAFSKGGTSVPEFIRDCRLEHARQLMIERPDMTLIEIAAASGIVHASTFTVDFKNKYGASPTKYREEQQKENPDENY